MLSSVPPSCNISRNNDEVYFFMTHLEKRHTRRYKLADPVDYWWLDPSGSVQASHGMTLDISSSGVMVIARKCPPKGVRIQTTIHVARHDGSDRPLELHGEGIVVRIEPGKATQPGQRSSGFAALVHFYSELSNDSDDPDQDTSEP
jgi:hypothetical protein